MKIDAPAAIRRIARLAAFAIGWLGMLFVAYLVVGLIGGAIPANRDWRPPARGVTIFVEDNGIHTDLVLPVAAAGIDWRGLIRPEDFADPRFAGYRHLAFGWGERRFYMETPTWSDVRPATIFHAATGSDDTAMHVGYVAPPIPARDVRAIVLRPEEYRRLAAFIRAGFAIRGGRPIRLGHGYYGNDTFYGAKGHYDAFVTCNVWTGRALRTAGVRIGRSTPFPATMMRWF